MYVPLRGETTAVLYARMSHIVVATETRSDYSTHPTAPGKPRTMPTDTPALAVVEADMVRMVEVEVEVSVCPIGPTRLTLTLQIAQANGLAGVGKGVVREGRRVSLALSRAERSRDERWSSPRACRATLVRELKRRF